MNKFSISIIFLILSSSPLYAGICEYFPFWGDAAREEGYDLPRTCGISIVSTGVREYVDASNMNLSTPNSAFAKTDPGYINKVMKGAGFGVDYVDVKALTNLVRFDMWVFPFLNLYAVGGRTDGSAKVQVSFSKYDSPMGEFLQLMGVPKRMNFNLNFAGVTYGGGATLATGYKDIFAIVNYAYVITSLDILSGNVTAQTVSTSLGYKVTPKIRIWTGAFYENIRQTVHGPIPPGMVPSQQMVLIMGKDSTFSVDAKSRHEINPLVGFQYAFNKHWNLNMQGTFYHRNSVMGQVSYRF